jgi:ribonuclease J
MNIIIHRGSHEIGGSCVEIRSERNRILVDIGLPLSFTGNGGSGTGDLEKLSGKRLLEKGLLPDIEGIYTWDNRWPVIDALIISHPHLDHYGFIRYLKDQVPIYIGKAAKDLLQSASVFTSFPQNVLENAMALQHRKGFACGDFNITPYLMDHSAFDAYAFLIEAEGKRIFYSGDFRAHGRKAKMFEWLVNHGPTGIDALLMEGTVLGSSRITAVTESDIEQRFVDRIQRTGNSIVMAYSSSQNIDRLVSLYRAVLQTNRFFVVDVYTASILDCLKKYSKVPFPSRRYSRLKVLFTRWQCDRLKRQGNGKIMYKFRAYKITKEEISANPERICMLVRPSLKTDLEKINCLKGGALIYSMWEGYLEQPYIKAFKLYLEDRGVFWHNIHTGGHATLETLKRLVQRLKPKVLVPIHTQQPGEYSKHFSRVKVVKDKEMFSV